MPVAGEFPRLSHLLYSLIKQLVLLVNFFNMNVQLLLLHLNPRGNWQQAGNFQWLQGALILSRRVL